MEEIKVGEYVRSSKGVIAKVISVGSQDFGFGDFGIEKMYFCNTEPHFYEEIVKHSPNIIDLIEAGDFVNEYQVMELYGNEIILGNEERNL